MGIGSRLKHAWNAFAEDEQFRIRSDAGELGTSYSVRPDRVRFRFSNERSIISSIYTRLSIDVAATDIRHVRLDANDRYLEDMDSGLNNCLTLEANLDQAARAFRQDIAMTLFDNGSAAIVPVDTSMNPLITGGYDILTLRVGEIIQWYPRHVKLNLYNEKKGRREEITLEKSVVAIVENPLYAVMNEPNSTLKRLIRKLNLLDKVDEESSSGKLDLIIQLPYVIKSEGRRQQAEQRRKDVEFQLKGSQYGIAYSDATEKITQLNRPVENNLLDQIKMLKEQLYGELGLTPEVMNGTADEKVMLNYYNRTIEPIVAAITESMKRTFLTKTARSQKQSVLFFKEVFKLVPVGDMAEIADKFTRNEIFTSNEIRQFIGVKPAKDPKADQLVNSNMPQADTGVPPAVPTDQTSNDEAAGIMNEAFDSVDSTLNDVFNTLGVDENAV